MSTRNLAAHVLRTLATAHVRGRRLTLDDVVERLEVRRTDVRSVLAALHRESLVDVTTMRLTLQGFAIGTALRRVHLPPLRASEETTSSQVRAA